MLKYFIIISKEKINETKKNKSDQIAFIFNRLGVCEKSFHDLCVK